MRIAITGPHKDEVIARVESALNTEARKPWGDTAIDTAAMMYKEFLGQHTVFSGSPFDYLYPELNEGYDDVYEQVAINSLDEIDYLAVITMDMDRNTQKMYEEYQKLFPDKIYLYSTPTEFELMMR